MKPHPFRSKTFRRAFDHGPVFQTINAEAAEPAENAFDGITRSSAISARSAFTRRHETSDFSLQTKPDFTYVKAKAEAGDEVRPGEGGSGTKDQYAMA